VHLELEEKIKRLPFDEREGIVDKKVKEIFRS